jgi:hypothetical protein
VHKVKVEPGENLFDQRQLHCLVPVALVAKELIDWAFIGVLYVLGPNSEPVVFHFDDSLVLVRLDYIWVRVKDVQESVDELQRKHFDCQGVFNLRLVFFDPVEQNVSLWI